MRQRLDVGDTIVIPLRHTSDLERVATIALRFAEILDRRLEVVSIVHPADHYETERDRIESEVIGFARKHGTNIETHVVAHVSPRDALLEFCADRLVCMATSGSPFERDHYVGSHAATLLAHSRAPVILVGPAVAIGTPAAQRVVVAATPEVDCHEALVTGRVLAKALDGPIAKISIDERGIVYEADYEQSTTGVPKELHASMVRGVIDDQRLCQILVERSRDSVLVLATRANRGLAWICEGSVAFDAVRHAEGPVVALGPNASFDFALNDRETRTAPANAT